MSEGSGVASTTTAAAPAFAASRSSPRTQATGWPKNITSSVGSIGSSCLTPWSLTPGTSAAVMTRTTPGTAYAGAASTRSRLAWACSDWTG
ncbi:Uncharacterised protein [Mycobacteroides abscessus subsp. abscessus]|nr:Uncharacterised protein [Mycobacteroides abscessus subsp. abscessus]